MDSSVQIVKKINVTEKPRGNRELKIQTHSLHRAQNTVQKQTKPKITTWKTRKDELHENTRVNSDVGEV